MCAFRVDEHRVDDIPEQTAGRPHPVAESRARERDALSLVDPLLSVQRQGIGILIHDHARDKPRACHAARNGRLGRGLDAHAFLGFAFRRELRTNDPDPHEARGPPFERFAHLFADPHEGRGAFALGLGREELDFVDGQVLG